MVEASPYLLPAVELSGAVLAGLIALVAHRGIRLNPSRALVSFEAGFGLLALGQALAAVMEVATVRDPEVARSGFDGYDVLFWSYNLSLLAGFVCVFASFGRHPFKWNFVAAPVLLVAWPVLQLLQVIVLFFVVLHAGFNHIGRARPGTLQTATGFFLVLLAHFLFMVDLSAFVGAAGQDFLAPTAALNPRNLAGELVNVVGLLLLYLAASRPRGST